MANLTKMLSGLLFEDDFNNPVLSESYTLSSTDLLRISLSELPGYFRMKHGDKPFFALLDEPEGDYLIEIKNDYIPQNSSDQSGIIVWRTMDDFIQLLEWNDVEKSISSIYPYIRLEKRSSNYSGYGSQDGLSWDMIGSISFMGACKVGLVVNGQEEAESVPFDVDYIKLYRGKNIQITNLPEAYRVVLLDANGVQVTEQTVGVGESGVKLDITNALYPYTARVRIFNPQTEMTIETELMQVTGGDIYYYGDLLEIYRMKDGQEFLMEHDNMNDLGTLVNGNIDVLLKIKNETLLPFYNIKVKVAPYGSIYGNEWATLAWQKDDGSKDVATKELNLAIMQPGVEKYFHILLTRDTNHIIVSLDPYRFSIFVVMD